jgi:hypothetical protein
MSGGNGDTLRRDAPKGADSAVWASDFMQPWPERWRTELELCGCESFDDGHRSAALGTAPQRVRGRSGRRLRFVLRWSAWRAVNTVAAGGTPSVCEEAEVADANEALGEQVKQEAT